ncbi:MAG: hypothetical protein JSV03_06565, partial [Planctomycetota bacterium]
MSRRKEIGSSLVIPGIITIVIGVIVLSLNPSSAPAVWFGAGILLAGLFTTVSTIYTHESGSGIIKGNDRSTNCNIKQESTINPNNPIIGRNLGSFDTGEMTADFIRWFDQQEAEEPLWPAFDRWIRETMNKYFGAHRVRCFKITRKSHRLTSLSGEPDWGLHSDLSQYGLIEYVISIGRCYVRG